MFDAVRNHADNYVVAVKSVENIGHRFVDEEPLRHGGSVHLFEKLEMHAISIVSTQFGSLYVGGFERSDSQCVAQLPCFGKSYGSQEELGIVGCLEGGQNEVDTRDEHRGARFLKDVHHGLGGDVVTSHIEFATAENVVSGSRHVVIGEHGEPVVIDIEIADGHGPACR